MRYLVFVHYLGGTYCGWQIQKNQPTIQATITEKLSIILDKPTQITGAGRTDAGVHAMRQAFHFDSAQKINSQQLITSLNALLPADIRVDEIKEVSTDFHAQKNSTQKTYFYLISQKQPSAFLKDFAFEYRYPLDFPLIQKALGLFEGKHDFRCFTVSDRNSKTSVREVLSVKLLKKPKLQFPDVQWNLGKDCFAFEFCGRGFLKQMVRLMVGALLQLGREQLTFEDIKQALVFQKPLKKPLCVSACGLFLKKVDYENG